MSISVSTLLLMASSAHSAVIDCSAFEQWETGGTYNAGEKVAAQGKGFEAKWWNQTDPTQKSGPWQEWKNLGECQGDTNTNTPPTVSWISPENNSSFTETDSVVISFSVQDSDGSIEISKRLHSRDSVRQRFYFQEL